MNLPKTEEEWQGVIWDCAEKGAMRNLLEDPKSDVMPILLSPYLGKSYPSFQPPEGATPRMGDLICIDMAREKHEQREILKRAKAEMPFFCVVIEAWFTRCDSKNKSLEDVIENEPLPSQSPNRQEALLIALFSRGELIKVKFVHFKRDKEAGTVELQDTFEEMKGGMNFEAVKGGIFA